MKALALCAFALLAFTNALATVETPKCTIQLSAERFKGFFTASEYGVREGQKLKLPRYARAQGFAKKLGWSIISESKYEALEAQAVEAKCGKVVDYEDPEVPPAAIEQYEECAYQAMIAVRTPYNEAANRNRYLRYSVDRGETEDGKVSYAVAVTSEQQFARAIVDDERALLKHEVVSQTKLPGSAQKAGVTDSAAKKACGGGPDKNLISALCWTYIQDYFLQEEIFMKAVQKLGRCEQR